MATLNKMTGFKVYKGTKDTFINDGKASQYADAIVFITGGTGNEKNSCIFAQGTYFANISELIKAINYVKGVKVGEAAYNAAAGGGYVEFTGAANNTVALDVVNGKITIGLTDEFINKVNNTATLAGNTSTALGTKDDEASASGSAFARIAALANAIGSNGSVSGQITNAINNLRTEIVGTLGTDDAKTLEAINDELDSINATWKDYVSKAELADIGDNKEDGEKVKVKVTTLGGKVTAVEVTEDGLTNALNLKANAADVYTKTDADTMAQGKVDALANGAVKANTAAIATLNGNSSVPGSVDKKIVDAIDAFASKVSGNGTIDTLKELVDYVAGVDGSDKLASAIDQIADNKGKIETLNGDEDTAGSVAKAIADEAARAEAAYAVKGTESVASGAAARANEAYALAETKQTADQVSTAISGALNAIAEVIKTGDGTYVDVTVKTAKGSVTEVTVDDSSVKTYADGVGAAAKSHAETKISEAVGVYTATGVTASGLRKEIEERDAAVKSYADSLFAWEEI